MKKAALSSRRSDKRFSVNKQPVKEYSFVFRLVYLVVCLGVLAWLVHKSEITAPNNYLPGLALAIGGIIGASVAIFFSFSSFTLQSVANLFSTRHLDYFAKELTEKIVFVGLVFLTLASFSIPVIFQQYPKWVLGGVLMVLLVAFFLIYELYIELRKRINPKIVLERIEMDAIKNLEKIREKYVRIPNNIPENKEKIGRLNPALNHVNCLHEIGLRLLARNEIESFNTAVDSIYAIYLKHLELGDGYFIGTQEEMTDVNTHLLFTARLFHCLQSMGERIIQEKRKENIYHLFGVYKNIINHSFDVRYINKETDNPLLQSAFHHYKSFIEKLLAAKNKEWSYGAVRNLTEVSAIAMQKKDNPHVPLVICCEIHQMLDEVSKLYPPEKDDASFVNITTAYFHQIQLAWDKRMDNLLFWDPLFKGLEPCILSMPVDGHFLLTDVFNDFHAWQHESTLRILESKGGWGKKKDDFVTLLEKWGRFLFNFAKQHGLCTQIGKIIIYSVGVNLNFIYMIRNKFQAPDNMDGIYRTYINVFTYFFEGADKIQDTNKHKISWGNFYLALGVLWHGISYNLNHGYFDVDPLINRYIGLVEDYLKRSTDGFSEIINYLSNLATLLEKRGKPSEAEKIRSKINELKKKHSSTK